MNRNVTYKANNHNTAPATAEWFMLLIVCLAEFFARREVCGVLRLTGAVGIFMFILGVVSGIESGAIALLPGALMCFALAGLAFILVRRLHDLL